MRVHLKKVRTTAKEKTTARTLQPELRFTDHDLNPQEPFGRDHHQSKLEEIAI
jgi:hypothetical protein